MTRTRAAASRGTSSSAAPPELAKCWPSWCSPGRSCPASGAIAKRIRERAPGLTTLVTDVNSRRTSQVLAGSFRTLYGPGFIFDRLCGLEFRLSPGAFYQVNHAQTEKLYASRASSPEAAGGLSTPTAAWARSA